MSIKILIVDDHILVAEGIVALLRTFDNIGLIGVAKNGEECKQFCLDNDPDIVLLDINLPDISGILLVDNIRKINPSVKIIIITGQNPDKYITSAFEREVNGFLLKTCCSYELLSAISNVFNGELYYSPSLGLASTEHLRKKFNIDKSRKEFNESLTPRELETIKLISMGLRNKEIAKNLGVKIRTVDYHVSNVLAKLGVNSRLEAVLKWKSKYNN